MVTIFELVGGRPKLFASAPTMAEASALLPHGAYTTLRTYETGRRVLTLDRKHFGPFRTRRGKPLELLPASRP